MCPRRLRVAQLRLKCAPQCAHRPRRILRCAQAHGNPRAEFRLPSKKTAPAGRLFRELQGTKSEAYLPLSFSTADFILSPASFISDFIVSPAAFMSDFMSDVGAAAPTFSVLPPTFIAIGISLPSLT